MASNIRAVQPPSRIKFQLGKLSAITSQGLAPVENRACPRQWMEGLDIEAWATSMLGCHWKIHEHLYVLNIKCNYSTSKSSSRNRHIMTHLCCIARLLHECSVMGCAAANQQYLGLCSLFYVFFSVLRAAPHFVV